MEKQIETIGHDDRREQVGKLATQQLFGKRKSHDWAHNTIAVEPAPSRHKFRSDTQTDEKKCLVSRNSDHTQIVRVPSPP